jgi:hypothetical protein
MSGASDALLRRLAVPRLPGSAALADIEDLLVGRLRDLGYDVTATRFTATSEPLDAAGALGAGLVWIALLLVPLLLLPVPGWTVMLVPVPALAALALVSLGIARGRLGVARYRGAVRNVEGRRGTPRAWLVAHSDSKAQVLSLRGRVVAAMLTAMGAAVLLGGVVARVVSGPLPWPAAVGISLPLLVGGALLSRSAPSDGSPGAVDNATGMIAVLAAAEALADRADVGVLVTGGEEFGMRGARVWVTEASRNAAFVNFDGIDSRGVFRVMVHGSTMGRARATAMTDLVAEALRGEGQPVLIGRLPPGVFVDGAVLARAGMPGVTVSRGDWSTLGVIHTPRDVTERLDPEVAVSTGRAVALAVRRWLG